MRLSRFLLPILKENPKEAEIASHRLMLRAGMIRQEAAGIYAWLPLGLRVLKKIEQIVRKEQDRAGALELLMPTLQLADLWRESGRYDAYGPEMLRITDRHKRELLYGPTNEEMITEIFRAYVKSYKSLPLNLYHIQWKFRDEQRPRFGVMRGREFLMKDAYSFDLDEAAARRSYNKMFVAYLRTFARMGLKAIPMRAETGPIGGDLSHEFIVLAETGESAVYCDSDVLNLPVPGEEIDYEGDLTPVIQQWTSVYAATEDVHDAARFDREVPDEKKLQTRGIEVGQIFYFGTKYSDSMKAMVAGPDGAEVAVHGGSYGVGVSRLVGAIIVHVVSRHRQIENIAVAIDAGLAGFSQHDKFVAEIAADRAGFSAHRDRLQSHPREGAQIGDEHLVVGMLSAREVEIEGIGIFHQELACAHHTEARPHFVAELPLDVIEIERQALVGFHIGAENLGDHLFVGRPKEQFALVPVGNAQHFRAVGLVAAAFAPEICELQRRHQKF